MSHWELIFKQKERVFPHPQVDIKNIIPILKNSGFKKVLDLGCGTGRHTTLLAKEGFKVYSTDISSEGLRQTKEWLKAENLSATLKLASCYEKFPFRDNFFDAIISTQAIHHNYHNKVKFCISEIERVLKPNGILFITFPLNKKGRGATKYKIREKRTFIPLDGPEKGLPHFIYTKSLIKEDFSNFKILDLYKNKKNHYCFLGKLK